MRKLGNMPSPPPSPMPGRQRVPGGNQPAPPFMTRNPWNITTNHIRIFGLVTVSSVKFMKDMIGNSMSIKTIL